MFELTDAVLCADGPVTSLVELTLVAEHRRGHGAMYDALNQGRIEPERLRRSAGRRCRCPRAADGRIVLGGRCQPVAAPGRRRPARTGCSATSTAAAKGNAQLIPGWPYSFVAALETGRTSWTALLDAVRLGPADDATAVTAAQLREVVERLIAAGHWRPGDPDILIVADAGYDVTRAGLPAGRPARRAARPDALGPGPAPARARPRHARRDRPPAASTARSSPWPSPPPGPTPDAHHAHRDHPLRHRGRDQPGTGSTPG